jgi:hypothetical protein
VDPADLISKASAAEAVRQTTGKAGAAPAMSDSEVADVFGIELAPQSSSFGPAVDVPAPTLPTPASASSPAPKLRSQQKQKITHRVSAKTRARIAAIARARWAKLKEQQQDSLRTLPSKRRKTPKAA